MALNLLNNLQEAKDLDLVEAYKIEVFSPTEGEVTPSSLIKQAGRGGDPDLFYHFKKQEDRWVCTAFKPVEKY